MSLEIEKSSICKDQKCKNYLTLMVLSISVFVRSRRYVYHRTTCKRACFILFWKLSLSSILGHSALRAPLSLIFGIAKTCETCKEKSK